MIKTSQTERGQLKALYVPDASSIPHVPGSGDNSEKATTVTRLRIFAAKNQDLPSGLPTDC